MNKNLKVVLSFSLFTVALLVAYASFNYFVDPMCYYRCDTIEIKRPTQNVYYEAAQLIAANKDAEVLILGSSRGQSVSGKWVQGKVGAKTLNLSKGGADVLLKLALLRTALEYKLPLKKVIWIADYFEVAGNVTDAKVRQTHVLRKHLGNELPSEMGIKARLESVQRLIDHNSLEASFAQLSSLSRPFEIPQSGVEINYGACLSADFKGKTPVGALSKEVDISYFTFVPILQPELNESYLASMIRQVQSLAQSGVEVLIVIPPYHPQFIQRFKKDFPVSAKEQARWLDSLNAIQSEKIRVTSFWDGIPGDDAGPTFWNDGAHPTCKSMILMLEKGLGATWKEEL